MDLVLFTADRAQLKARIAVSISSTGVEIGMQMFELSLRNSCKISRISCLLD
jgi:hypothetical protein